MVHEVHPRARIVETADFQQGAPHTPMSDSPPFQERRDSLRARNI